jgi:hypothetical protein
MLTKKLIYFDLSTIEEHTGCTPWMPSTHYSVKLLSSLLWTEVFMNTRNCSKLWSTRKGHTFPKRFSMVQRGTAFPHGAEHTQSVWLKAVPQSDFKGSTYILNTSEFQIEQEKSHTQTHTHADACTYTHTKCRHAVHYLVSKFFIFNLFNDKVEQTRSHWTPGQPGALHQFP